MEVIDVSDTIVAKSDQLNADDLVGGPITVRVVRVGRVDGDQPILVHIDGYRPWKPCKTMRRVLVLAWGADAARWVGRTLTLFRDSDVRWAGDAVGGIRVAAMSDIPKRIEVSLAVSKGKKSKHVIEILKAQPMTLDDLKRACSAALKAGWTRGQITTELGGQAADVAPGARRDVAARLAGAPPAVEVSDPAPMSTDEMAAILAAEKAEEQAQ